MTKVTNLPREPGVYLFTNINQKVLYVGKAKDLKSRVSSYFQKSYRLEPKTEALVQKIADLNIVQTASELEALILEAELIRKHRPKYNIIQKDDKSNLYIVIRKETLEIGGQKAKLPKIITARKTDLLKNDIKYGPFTNSQNARQVLAAVRKIFPFRDCSVVKFRRYKSLNKPCLYGHLGLCPAPCLSETNLSSVSLELNRLKDFLSGRSTKIVNDYKRRMNTSAQKKRYEEAAYYRDMLRKFQYMRTSFTMPDQYIDNPNLLEDLAAKSLKQLRDVLPILDKEPTQIECYDISNLSGQEAVGAMVVGIDGRIRKDKYKRFKIRVKSTPDDTAMLKEVLTRRFLRAINSKVNDGWSLPELLVMDGGKAQVSAALDVSRSMKIDLPIIGLAKRYERIVYEWEGKLMELEIPRDNEGLKLLIRLRDEAHRYAQSYHHRLRLKRIKV